MKKNTPFVQRVPGSNQKNFLEYKPDSHRIKAQTEPKIFNCQCAEQKLFWECGEASEAYSIQCQATYQTCTETKVHNSDNIDKLQSSLIYAQ